MQITNVQQDYDKMIDNSITATKQLPYDKRISDRVDKVYEALEKKIIFNKTLRGEQEDVDEADAIQNS